MCSSVPSAQVRGTMAHTAFVEPPITLMTAIALRKDLRVTISLRVSLFVKVCYVSGRNQTHFGLRSSSIKFFRYFGALKHS